MSKKGRTGIHCGVEIVGIEEELVKNLETYLGMDF